MKLQILAFRYFDLPDLRRVADDWIQKRSKAEVDRAFQDILREEDWESKAEPSTLPEVNVYFYTGDNVGDVITTLVKFEEIQKVRVHAVKVAPNPLAFRRALLMECELKDDNLNTQRSPLDRLKIALDRDLDRIDSLFTPATDSLSELGQNMWLVIGDPETEPQLEQLRTAGFDEVPVTVSIRAQADAALERYFSSDAYYVVYSKVDCVPDLELSDLVFLLLVPAYAQELRRRVEKWTKSRDQWQEEVNDLIVGLSTSPDPDASKDLVAKIVQKLIEYFVDQRLIDRDLVLPTQTLRDKVASAARAPEKQIHQVISSDMDTLLKGIEARIASIVEGWRDHFHGLRDMVSISALSAQLQVAVRESKVSEDIEKILQDSGSTSQAIRDILRSGNTIAMLVGMFVFFQAPFIAGETLNWSAPLTAALASTAALIGAFLAYALPRFVLR